MKNEEWREVPTERRRKRVKGEGRLADREGGETPEPSRKQPKGVG
jgi:hypothetical protein